MQATAEETVAFSWVEWPHEATRDPGNPPMPFDGKCVIFGGFEPGVEVKA